MIEQEGICTTWFTFSAADNHWLDLNKIIYRDRPLPVFHAEKEKCKWRRKLIRNNPHIVDSYFYDRVKAFINTFHSKNGLELSWFWFRVEYQNRGTAHVHGCLRLKDDPGIEELSRKVLKGRISERKLRLLGLMPENNNDNNDNTIHDDFISIEELKKIKSGGIFTTNI